MLLAPALLLRAWTSVYPFFLTAYLSFTESGPMRAGSTWVGWKQYERIFSNQVTVSAFWFTIVFAVASTVLEIVAGLLLGLLLCAEFRGRWWFRSLILIPWAMPAVVSALGFRFMFSDGFGIITHLLSFVGIHVDWLTSPGGAQAAVIFANAWRVIPFIGLMAMAGLSGIPKELYQAARVDGAGRVRIFFEIELPLITPLLVTIGAFMMIFQVGGFDVILGMTGGGPGTSTQVLSYLAYLEAFVGLEYGRASAISMVLFVLVLLTGLIAMAVSRKTEVEY